jgi:hypothetical protein
LEIASVVSRGVRFVNTTPHEINLMWADGEEFVVPASGILVNAKVVEAAHPGAVVLGSIIAAQAFPGRVLALTPAPGFERVPPSEKKMRADKFTTFG